MKINELKVLIFIKKKINRFNNEYWFYSKV